MKKYRLANNVKLHELENSLYLIDFNEGTTFKISDISSYIIKELINEKSIKEIINLINCKYKCIDYDKIEQDVISFYTKILEKKLIIESELNSSHCDTDSSLTVIAHGDSMLPLIQNGDKIKLQNNLGNISIDDIVAVSYNKTIILHRVVDMNNEMIVTKGDNNIFYEIPISKKNIIGVTHHHKISYEQIVIGNYITLNTVYYINNKLAKKASEDLNLDINNSIEPDKKVLRVILAPTFKITQHSLTKITNWDFCDKQNEINIMLVSNFSDNSKTGYINTIKEVDVIIPFFSPLLFFKMDLNSYIFCAINNLGLLANASKTLDFNKYF